MAFMDKVTEIAGKAVDKGNEVVEVTKLKSRISSCEKDITSLKTDIADYVIGKIESGDETDAQIVELSEQIKGKLAEIEDFEAQIAQIKG